MYQPSVDYLMSVTAYRLKRSENDRQNESQRIEEEYFQMVTLGDVEGIERFVAHFKDHDPRYDLLGEVAQDQVKQLEYMAVIGISLGSRAAIRGGLNPVSAYDINDIYLQKLAKAKNTAEFGLLTVESTLHYARLVRDLRNEKSRCSYVENVKEYTVHNLTKALSCEILAEKLGLSPDYLSRIFVHETGTPLKRYFQNERIRAASNMLRFSNVSVSEIATYLGFSSQSYFGKVFKDLTGFTPNQFRLQLQRPEFIQ